MLCGECGQRHIQPCERVPRTAASRCSVAGAMPERISRCLSGVVRSDPENVHKDLFSGTSSFLCVGFCTSIVANFPEGDSGTFTRALKNAGILDHTH